MTTTPLSAAPPPDTHVRLRPATPADLPTIHALIVAVGLSSDPALVTATLEGSTYTLAEQDGAVVGCVGLEHGEGASLLRSVCVLPAQRGRGLGRALALSALTQASLRGDGAVYLFSSHAGAYWQALDFSPVPVTELETALPGVPQVLSGQCRGWISAELAWRRRLGRATVVGA